MSTPLLFRFRKPTFLCLWLLASGFAQGILCGAPGSALSTYCTFFLLGQHHTMSLSLTWGVKISDTLGLFQANIHERKSPGGAA